MQTKSAIRTNSHRSHSGLQQDTPRRAPRRTPRPARHSTTPRLILAPGPSLQIPSLEGTAYDYRLISNLDTMAELAAQCVDSGLGSPELWAKSGKNPSVFLEMALQAHAESQNIEFIESTIEVWMNLWKVYEDNPDEFMLTMGISKCAALVVGEQAVKLEAIHAGLAAAWYRVLCRALSRGGLLFDYFDSVRHYEYLMEQSEEELQDAEANNELANFNPDRFIPECLKTAVKSPGRGSSTRDVRLLREHRDGPASCAIEPVLKMWQISQKPEFAVLKENSERDEEATQLPYCIVAFEEGDSVFAAFDEFGRYAYENSVDETLIERRLNVKSPKDFPRAIQGIDCYFAFLRSLSTLYGILNNSPNEPNP